ncbi:hypothetical protein QL285_040853 [Trifolium repens]|jgi:hypothetical protein|nr:hypothetical protein QL285_040853 [Trifolium repens]
MKKEEVDNCVAVDGTIILRLCVQRPTSQPSTRLCFSNELLCAVIRGRKFQVCGEVELEGTTLNSVREDEFAGFEGARNGTL